MTQQSATMPAVPAAPFPSSPAGVRLAEVYDALRLARLNDKYYGDALNGAQRWANAGALLTAVAASSSVIAAVTAASGKNSGWVIALSIVAAIAVAAKPILDLDGRVERLTRLWSGWHAAFTTLARVRTDIEASEGWRPELTPLYIDLLDRMDRLSSEDDSAPDRATVARFTDEVNQEIPADSLWMPSAA